MRKVLLVARREYVETARTKMFWFGALVPIAVFVTMILIGARQMKRVASAPVRGPVPQVWRNVAVSDLSGNLFVELEAAAEHYNAGGPALRITLRPVEAGGQAPEAVKARLDGEVLQGKVDAYLVLPGDILSGEATAALYVRDWAEDGLYGVLHGLVGDALTAVRLREHGVPADTIAKVQQGVSLSRTVVAPSGQQGAGRTGLAARDRDMMVAFFCLFVMFFTIVSTSQALLTALIEERGSRVIEVLLSAVSPLELMAGKILGLAGIGLTLAAVFTAAILGTASSQGLLEGVRLGALPYLLPYYLLGFLLVASLYAAVGAACSTLKEAQAMMMPVMLLLMLPVVAWMPIVQNPHSLLVIALSLFPPTAPMVMTVRLASSSGVSVIQVTVSLLLLAVSAPLVTWGAARAFRTGILMYGKPPKLRELLRWMRQG